MTPPISDDLVGQRTRRLEKLETLRKLGVNPYPSQSQKDCTNKNILDNFSTYEQKEVVVTGRIMSWREHGAVIFSDIRDMSGDLQLWISKDTLVDDLKNGCLGWEELKLLDTGDFIQAKGLVVKTSRGAISIAVKNITLLSKSIRPIPQRLADKEELLRKRYLDILLHTEKKELFLRKERFFEANRTFLKKYGFVEVFTPVLEHVTGGADARPFTTHHNDLHEDFYLRISTELYQKRLIGAGFEKIFTIGPNFRNEGISDEHLQEYNQVEWYWAYADYRDNMRLVRDSIRYIAQSVYGKTAFSTRGLTFDLAEEWKELDYKTVIQEHLGIDIFNDPDEKIQKVITEKGIHLKGVINRSRLIDNAWKIVRKTISGPAFLVNEPAIMSPLAKAHTDDPALTERFHVILAGSELGNGYSEINDPQYQLEQFLAQQKLREAGDDEAQMLDIDFVEMLEYGMPPTSGYAHSERLFWFLEGVSAREGTLFPQMSFIVDEMTKKIYGEKVIQHTKHGRSKK